MHDRPMRLRLATSFQEFERSPLNRYWLDEHYCFWQLGSDACGLLSWGAPSHREAQAMVRAFEVTLHPPVGRHLSLVDVRELTAIDSVGFEIIQDYMLSRRDAFEPVVERQALLCRADAFGAAIIGMYHFVAPRYPFEVFTSIDAALEFLSPPRRVELAAELEGLREQVFGTAPFLLQLRASLAESKTIPSLAELAQVFGMSQRTFQRRLAQHRTSYELELTRWRISRAEELLANTALSLTDVAKRVGFAGSSSFVAAFRTARGVPPEAWRRQHRPTRG